MQRTTGPVQVVVATLAALAVGLAVQLTRLGTTRSNGDIGALFASRGVRPHALPYLDRPLEYPVVVGYVMWATSWVGHTATTYLLTNAALLAPLAVVTAVILQRRDGARALLFAAAPTLALYSFHNWDLVPVAASVAGLVALERRRAATAGVLLAIGGWAKIYPGLWVPPIAVLLWIRGERDQARRLLAGTALTTAVLNAPVLVTAWDGWWRAVRFQNQRDATWGSLWYHLVRLPGLSGHGLDAHGVANAMAAAAFVVGAAVVLRRSVTARVSPTALAGAMTITFLLTSKVYSPQYSLWLLPFFVLLPLSVRLWGAMALLDVAMYVVVFGRFRHGDHLFTIHARVLLIRAIVFARAAVLGMSLRQILWPGGSPVGRSAATEPASA
jgi:uncharacterized membrane protein